MAQKTALIILAEGCEPSEAVITIDVLRRAHIKVTIASLEGEELVTCDMGIQVKAECSLNDVVKLNQDFDVIVLPGGVISTDNLSKSPVVKSLLKRQEETYGLIAAICAAPVVLKAHDIGMGRKVTAYPDRKLELVNAFYTYVDDKIVIDGNLITGKGPNYSIDFGLSIIEKLIDKRTRNNVARVMMARVV